MASNNPSSNSDSLCSKASSPPYQRSKPKHHGDPNLPSIREQDGHEREETSLDEGDDKAQRSAQKYGAQHTSSTYRSRLARYNRGRLIASLSKRTTRPASPIRPPFAMTTATATPPALTPAAAEGVNAPRERQPHILLQTAASTLLSVLSPTYGISWDSDSDSILPFSRPSLRFLLRRRQTPASGGRRVSDVLRRGMVAAIEPGYEGDDESEYEESESEDEK
ncbi:hypothetical protein F4810DRAFT_721147 [Camillea tinctor]|nr:hypothetical protein F4810DRAFT_721147 [Camillea tinctor]